MKIIRAAKNNINKIEKVFVFKQSGARGPAGTISSLSTLDGKAAVVAADLALTGDSADSFANKKSTWQQIIDSVLTTAFNLVYQPLSTALGKITESGGLPLWDGAAWPGGGGDVEWSPVARTTVSAAVSSVDFIDKLTDDYARYRVRFVECNGLSTNAYFRIRLGFGAGPTWGVTESYTINESGFGSVANTYDHTSADLRLTNNLTTARKVSGKVFIFAARVAASLPNYESCAVVVDTGTQATLTYFGGGNLDDTTNKMDHISFGLNTGTFSEGEVILEGAAL